MSNVTRTNARSSESGAVSLKAILALALVGVVAFVAIKIAPVYIEQQGLMHDVKELARIAAVRGWKADRINQDIQRIRGEYNIPETGLNFVAVGEKGVHIAVNYQRNIDLIVTTYEWKVAETVVGKDL